MARVLVVDDNPDVLDALDLLLGLHGHTLVLASTLKDAIMAVQHKQIDLVIQDMNFTEDLTSGNEGKSLFYKLKEVNPNLPIVLITAWTHLDTAIELVKAGAVDYLPKPWDDEKLLSLINKYANSTLEPQSKTSLIYTSAIMSQLIGQAQRVASADINVMITGENGCGKEVLADYIHKHSTRQSAPFVKVNIGAIPPDLMEAELFGAEKGAFTGANSQRIGRFEAADDGTLFLDEIGNLSLSGQMKLLRVLQTGEFEKLGANTTQKVNVRVLCATNADLPAMVKAGSFREDLWFRLNVVELHLPPLRERKDDIAPLAKYFLHPEFSLSDDALSFLQQQSWPGNVRELQNACERAKVFSSSQVLSPADFQLEASVAINEKAQIEAALKAHKGVIKQTALALGLSRQALYRRIEKYKIDVENE